MRSDRDSGIWRALILSWAAVFALGVFFWSDVRAQAGAAVSAVGRSTIGVIERQWTRQGFAANDPRFIASRVSYGGAVEGAATNVLVVAGTGLLLGTPVGWGTLAVAALVGAGVAIAIDLYSDSENTLTLNPDGTYSYRVAGAWPTDRLPLSHACWSTPSGSVDAAVRQQICTSSPQAVAARLNALWPATRFSPQASPWRWTMPSGAPVGHTSCHSIDGCLVTTWPSPGQPHPAFTSLSVSLVSRTTLFDPPAPVALQTGRTSSQALSDLSPSVLNAPLSAQAEAVLANRLWSAASARDPSVIPYSPANAITPSDVDAWRAANPSAVPTVGQFLTQPALTLGTPMPQPQPGATPSTPIPGTGTPIDLGADPQIGPPTLESTPEASDILSPILNLGGDLRNIVITPQDAACPVASFNVFERNYSIDAHCSLIEPFRGLIQGAMMLVWLLIAAYAILRA